MKIIFKKGDRDKHYQCFETVYSRNAHRSYTELKNDHIDTIVKSFLYNEGEYHVPCYSFNGFINKYKRNTHPSDIIIFYYYPRQFLTLKSNDFTNTSSLVSFINWELENKKE